MDELFGAPGNAGTAPLESAQSDPSSLAAEAVRLVFQEDVLDDLFRQDDELEEEWFSAGEDEWLAALASDPGR